MARTRSTGGPPRAYIVMAYVVMAYAVMAYTVLDYIVMAYGFSQVV